MKKFLIAASALTAAFAATGAASAAPYDGGGRDEYRAAAYQGVNINQREHDIAFRIDQGQRNGGLTFREARMLREDLRNIQYLESRYRRDGMSRSEAADLDRRLDALSQRVRFNRHDDDRRGRW